jgi:hypothetical protein
MSEHSAEILQAVSEIRDLVRLLAEPAIAARDQELRSELRRIVGRSATKAKAVLLMDGSRTQRAIHRESALNEGHLSTLVTSNSNWASCCQVTESSQNLPFKYLPTSLNLGKSMSDERMLEVLTEIRNWSRAGSYGSVKKMLEEALPDQKSRAAFQMFDGTVTTDQVRIACKISPNALLALAHRWTAMGLMEMKTDKKRVRLFDLTDFGLLNGDEPPAPKVSQ